MTDTARDFTLAQGKDLLKGKEDFILFDNLEEAYANGEVVVISCDINDKVSHDVRGC